jgi:type IV pilus assembly protein PilX
MALIVGLILLVVMTIVGLVGVRVVSSEERLTGHAVDRSLSFQAAEAALREVEEAIEALKPRPTSGCSVVTVAPNSVMACAPPSPSTTPRWLDSSFASWTNASAVTSGGLSITPTYFAEYLGDSFPCSQSPDCSSQPCNCLRYRITSRAGDAGRAQAMVQSIYATDP